MVGSLTMLTALLMGMLLHVLWVLDGAPWTGLWSGPSVWVAPRESAPVEATESGSSQRLVDVGLDPGHSDADPGALAGGLREVDLTLPLAQRVKALLEEKDLTVVLTRSDDRPLSALNAPDPVDRVREEQEARIASAGETKVYVSLHFNGHPDRTIRGIETYFNPDNRGEESRRLAGSIQRHLVASVRATGYSAPDRGVRQDLLAGKPYGHFFSLRGSAPSVLVEAMFLTNPQEASLLAQPEVMEAVARGIAAGVSEYLVARD